MIFSNRDLVKIIVPLVIEQVLSISIGIMDSMMVSSAGEAAISGVSLVSSVNLFLIYAFSALSTGGAVIISQLMGKKDIDAARGAAKQLVWTIFMAALLVSSFAMIFRRPLLSLIFGSITEEVMRNALIYFLFTAMSYPFLAVYSSGAAIFRTMGNSKISMIASIIMNIINVSGNAILIFIFHLGAAGAAIATLTARIVGATMMMILVHNKKNVIYIEHLFHFKPNFMIIGNICRIGIPNGMENSMFQFGKVITQSLISTFGTVQIAANAVANSLVTLQYCAGSAIGLGMVPIVGRCIGAGEKEQAKKYTIKLLVTAYCIIIVVAGTMSIFAKPLIGIYGLSPESFAISKKMLLLHAVFVTTAWPTSFVLPNAFRAASDVKHTMILSIISMWIFRVGLSYVLGKYMGFGVIGVWFAMASDWYFRAIVFGVRYIRGTWLTKYKDPSC